ncbi:DUF6197 family protein [Streptomyces sp. NPDC051561]|uniref:DUF6197 family protein n=1 Tax=Streptomyces sp. NPDC051561 TaxID=3365658 RepID=UPI0037B72A05
MPTKTLHATPASILAAAAEHVERVGLCQGEHLWEPGKMGDTAPCNAAWAWGRGVRAAKPHRSVRGEPWRVFGRAHVEALAVISDHVNGTPILSADWEHLHMDEHAYRYSTLWLWGNRPGCTTAEVAAAFRVAGGLCLSEDDHIGQGHRTFKNMV